MSVFHASINVIFRNLHTWQVRLPLFVSVVAGLAITFKARQKSTLNTSTIPSPRTTLLPRLSPSEIAALPYRPDMLPGGRWVDSPYGIIKVYEWGSEHGKKVLLLHGISNPSPVLGGLASGLVGRGCRVMLIDLWGRGYSDSPADLVHDTRLYTTEILLAITSSNLSWTGAASGGFSIIGYSLGGGIAASFTSYFPRLVSSLVLLAPCGLLKPEKVTYSTRFFPESVLQYFAGRQLRNYKVSAVVPGDLDDQRDGTGDAGVAVSDVPGISTSAPNVSIPDVVAWQLEHHQAFLHSFMSCVRHAPTTNQHSDWRRLGNRLTAQNAASAADPEIQRDGLEGGKVLVIVGQTDPIITEEDLRPDAIEALGGPQNVDFRIARGGHEFPINNPKSTVSSIAEFWGLNS
ncbi:MAG: hypothetical protein M1840_005218 [Geoglossum simile]|nr:MAG: hypothetical protein M1840_005218 [Geoglossum simile]